MEHGASAISIAHRTSRQSLNAQSSKTVKAIHVKFYRYVSNDNDTLNYLKEGVALITATAFISTVLILTAC